MYELVTPTLFASNRQEGRVSTATVIDKRKKKKVAEMHRLQLSRNLRDSPGFVDFVPGPGGSSYLSRKVTD